MSIAVATTRVRSPRRSKAFSRRSCASGDPPGDPEPGTLSTFQSLMLASIVDHGAARLGSLADTLGTTDATASRTVDVLELHGLADAPAGHGRRARGDRRRDCVRARRGQAAPAAARATRRAGARRSLARRGASGRCGARRAAAPARPRLSGSRRLRRSSRCPRRGGAPGGRPRRFCSIGRAHLLVDEILVDGPRDRAEDAERDGARRLPRQPGEREGETGVVAARIVAEEPSDRGVDDLERPVGPHADALLAPADLLARAEVEAVVLLVADDVERAVVVDVAVLEDLDERGAAVRGGRPAAPRPSPACRCRSHARRTSPRRRSRSTTG